MSAGSPAAPHRPSPNKAEVHMSDKTRSTALAPGQIHVDDLPLRPNMLLTNARAISSTFASLVAEHSVLTGSNFFNSLFYRSNLEGCSFVGCEFDGALIENSSLRGVILKNCEVDGLVVNGIRVGALLRLLQGQED
jgi:uncharacterized protein YjbI with pentapeptide repeats